MRRLSLILFFFLFLPGADTVPREGSGAVRFSDLFERTCTLELPFDLKDVNMGAATDGRSVFVYGLEATANRYRLFHFVRCGSPPREITDLVLPPGETVRRVSAIALDPSARRLVVAFDLQEEQAGEERQVSYLQRYRLTPTVAPVGPRIRVPRPDPADMPIRQILPRRDGSFLLAALRFRNGEVNQLHEMSSEGRLVRSFFPLPPDALGACKGTNPFAEGAHRISAAALRDGTVLATNYWDPFLRVFPADGAAAPARMDALPGYVGPRKDLCRDYIEANMHAFDRRYAWLRSWTPVAGVFVVRAGEREFVLKGSLQAGGWRLRDWALEMFDAAGRRLGLTSVHECTPMAASGSTFLCGDWVVRDPSRPWRRTMRFYAYRLRPGKLSHALPDDRWAYRREPDASVPMRAEVRWMEDDSPVPADAFSAPIEQCGGRLFDQAVAGFLSRNRDQITLVIFPSHPLSPGDAQAKGELFAAGEALWWNLIGRGIASTIVLASAPEEAAPFTPLVVSR